jgi:hypothetical protein
VTELAEHEKVLSGDERVALVDALRAIRGKVCWKPGKDVIHLQKRRCMRRLPASVSLAGYEQIIYDIVRNGHNIVYLYNFS